MFDKFIKKKKDEEVKPESKTKQKNDLFTLLEETPEKSFEPKKITSDSKPDNEPKIESSSIKTIADTDSTTTTIKSDSISKPVSPTSNSKVESKPQLNPKTSTIKTQSSKIVSSSKSKSNYEIPESSIKGDKSQLLLLEIEKLPDKTIKPFVDFNDSCLFYPILAKIGEDPDNITFLEELVGEGTLIKEVYEKLIICPLHPDAYSSSVRLYCPKCNSVDVDKLNLYEHKRCGYITESIVFDFSNPKNDTCPSCKKKIIDFKKEIRVPAMWHQCGGCREKFDNAIIKLYCRKHEHDFDTNAGHFLTTYSYRLKDYDAPLSSDDDKLKADLERLLAEFNFSTEFKAVVTGKSGNSHKIPIFAKSNSTKEAIAIFVKRQIDSLTQTEINEILVPILDVGPKHTLLLTTATVDEGVKPLAKQYGIDVISDPDLSKIIEHVELFVADDYSRNGEK